MIKKSSRQKNKMTLTLQQLAALTGSEFRGDGSLKLTGVAPLQDASEGQISFVSNPKYKLQLKDTCASAVILSPELAERYEKDCAKGSANNAAKNKTANILVNKDPYLTFAKVVSEFNKQPLASEVIDASAVIANDVSLGANINIGPHVVIEAGVSIGEGAVIGAGCFIGADTKIKDDVHLYPNVTVYPLTRIGSRCIVHSGAVIGADGFGFAANSETSDGSWYKIPQVGNVVLGDDVEIGAGTTIDRAALGETRIGDGVKLDNQIQVGHNVELGENTIVAGCTVFAGSTKIGKRCQIGGAVAIAGHLEIADDVVITGKSMVIKSIRKPGVYSSGIATDENRKWRRNAARFRSLDDMARHLKQLEKRLLELEQTRN